MTPSEPALGHDRQNTSPDCTRTAQMTPDPPYCTPASQRLEALVGLGLDGLPLTKPPWGRTTAIDLNRGTHAWQVANG